MIGMDLLIVQMRLIWWARCRVVSIGKEGVSGFILILN
jgi:hypothetical protein